MSVEEWITFILVTLMLIFLTWLIIVGENENRKLRKEAIEKGFAQFNKKTGLWEWIK